MKHLCRIYLKLILSFLCVVPILDIGLGKKKKKDPSSWNASALDYYQKISRKHAWWDPLLATDHLIDIISLLVFSGIYQLTDAGLPIPELFI